MIISFLLLRTQSRSTGYISKQSKLAKLDILVQRGLIKDLGPQNGSNVVYQFEVVSGLKEIETTLQSNYIEYRKEP